MYKDFFRIESLFFKDFQKKNGTVVGLINGIPYNISILPNKVDESKVTKILLMEFSSLLKVGDLVEINNEKYILLEKQEIPEDTYSSFIALKCNYEIKWVDTDGIVKNTACFLDGSADKLVLKKYGFIGNVAAPKNPQTLAVLMPSGQKIAKGINLTIDGEYWRVVYLDKLSVKGLIYLSLEEREKTLNDLNDISDIDRINNITIEPAFKLPLAIKLQTPYELQFVTYRDGVMQTEISPVEIKVFENNKPVISNGISIQGNIITIKTNNIYNLRAYIKDTEIYSEFSVSVASITEENISIIGDDFIKWGQTSIYQVLLADIDNNYNIVQANFSLAPSNYARVVEIKPTSIAIQAVSYDKKPAEIALKAIFGGKEVEKKIKIVSILA